MLVIHKVDQELSIQFRRDRKAHPWVARYADGPSHRSSWFRTKADAQLFAAQAGR